MKKAFTMIELIFVIVILGILSAIVIPKMHTNRNDAIVVKTVMNITTLISDLNSAIMTKDTLLNYNTSEITSVPLKLFDHKEDKLYKLKDLGLTTKNLNKNHSEWQNSDVAFDYIMVDGKKCLELGFVSRTINGGLETVAPRFVVFKKSKEATNLCHQILTHPTVINLLGEDVLKNGVLYEIGASQVVW